MTYQIPMFAKKHMNAELRKKDGEWFWVRIPTAMDSLSRQRLVQTPEGLQAYGVYVHLVCISAKDQPRGVLADERGPFSIEDIALKTSIPQRVVEDALKLLASPAVGWVNQELIRNDVPDEPVHSNSLSISDSVSEKQQKTKDEGDPPGFVRWWKMYPGRNAAKQRCLGIWTGRKPLASGDRVQLEPLADVICEAVSAQDKAKHHQYSGKTMWPNSDTWLYNARWEDDLGTTTSIASNKWDTLPPQVKAELLKAVQDADPSVDHRAGNTETQRAMRKLAKERGLL